jgi:predicted CXXCH cytochrome family protein
VSIASVSVLVFMLARRAPLPVGTPAENRSPLAADRPEAYADPAVCATCHEDIAPTYALTGMARSFSRVDASRFAAGSRVYHPASDRYYTMVQRDGKLYQRRHQIGFGGTETNVLELEAQYVVGSGNHARTFLHRSPDGRLVQLPVSWYAERGGYWAMSPGYDRPAHMDFRRVLDTGCMSCHNGYPRGLVDDEGAGPRFGAVPLPDGIDCQRCHGPGQAHVEAVKSGDKQAVVLAIVNPGKLDRDRQLEACMQCHLESTSTPLPFRLQRYEQPPFSYTPGKPLSDYFMHFDHAPGTPGRDDKFEIAGGAYRLRKSACFQRSAMTCLTCHDPHDIPRGPAAAARQVAVCTGCHRETHRDGVPRVAGAVPGATCMDCHMPKRRTEDVVHVVMTDHYIQRRPGRDLVAARAESDSPGQGDYRGEVVLYYPPTLPATPENELYRALAQVQQGSNLASGIGQLEQAIEKHRPGRPEFYYELARAYSRTANYEAGIKWCREALQRDARFVPALKELAAAATAQGNMAEAAVSLEQALALRPEDGNAAADLGSVYLRQGRLDDAQKAVERALALDPTLPLAHNTMGLTAVRKGMAGPAETHFREAIRLQPDLAEAHNNLGNLLAGRRAYGEAAYHFEKAVASNPRYVEARHSYGVTLALTGSYSKAATEMEAAVELAPQLAALRIDLADVLARLGRREEARAHYAVAVTRGNAEEREAALAGMRNLERAGR